MTDSNFAKSVALIALLLPSGAALGIAPAAADGYVQLPGGVQIHKSCIFSVPNGGSVDSAGNVSNADGAFLLQAPQCAYPRRNTRNPSQNPPLPGINGWLEYAEVFASGSDYFDELYGEWYVPTLPTAQDGQTIYLFNSIQDYTTYTIIQPVLQYFGGSDGWQMQDYIVIGDTAYTGDAVSVNADDEIYGVQWLQESNEWTIKWQDVTGGTSWWINYTDLSGDYAPAYWQVANPGVLEVYGVNYCDDLPASSPVEFYDVGIFEGPNWNSYNQVDTVGSDWGLEIASDPSPSCSYSVSASPSYPWVDLSWSN